MLCRYVADTQI